MSNKSFSLFIDEVLKESASQGQKIEALTKRVMTELLKGLKRPDVLDRLKNKQSTKFSIDTDFVENLFLPIDKINVSFSFNLKQHQHEVNIGAEYVSTEYENIITITLIFPDLAFKEQMLSKIYPEIIESLRHELEHVSQHFATGTAEAQKDDLETLDDFINYYLDPSEVEAYISGLKLKASTQKRDLSELIGEKVEGILVQADDAGLSDEDMEDLELAVTKKYMSYAKDRYPGMK